MTVESILSNTKLVRVGSKFHIKMLYDERFSRYVRILLIFGNFRKLTESSGNLRRIRVFKSSNDILHIYMACMRVQKFAQKCSTTHRFRDNDNFRKCPETSEQSLIHHDHRIDSF